MDSRLRGNDEQRTVVKVVILGLDPGIHCVFNLSTKDTYFLVEVEFLSGYIRKIGKSKDYPTPYFSSSSPLYDVIIKNLNPKNRS